MHRSNYLTILTPEVKPGMVFHSKAPGPRGFVKGGTAWWLVVCVRGNAAHALGLDNSGNIVSTTSYGLHVFQLRECAGMFGGVKDFADYVKREALASLPDRTVSPACSS